MIPKLNSIVESIPEALSIFVNQIVYDKKSRGERVYTFSLGEAFFDIPHFEISDEAFRRGCHYSSSMGQPKLRERLSEMYQRSYGVRADPSTEILVSCGSKPILFMAMQAVLNPGDEVLVHEPGWLSYKEQVKLAGGVHVPIPYYDGVYEWERHLTDKTKLIVINSPNNPSGQLYSPKELEYLLKLAQEHGLFILSDEAYSDFLMPGDTFVSMAGVDTSKENTIVVNSLSKNMGMSGWRVGYAIAHQQVIEQLLKLNQHLLTCAATVLQDYMADHFDEILSATLPQAVETAHKRRAVQDILDDVGIGYLKGVGTFYFLIDVSSYEGETEELVRTLLMEHNIATVPGRAYGDSTADFVRFGIGVESLEDIEKCLRVIKSLI
ncbi:MAG: pyridoxal phosphate-dependent aminotransferase [Acidobacteriota bacterium]|nr:pyridoxal phosphate-dependent aminotransferase [Acidobacteriota bacterium]